MRNRSCLYNMALATLAKTAAEPSWPYRLGQAWTGAGNAVQKASDDFFDGVVSPSVVQPGKKMGLPFTEAGGKPYGTGARSDFGAYSDAADYQGHQSLHTQRPRDFQKAVEYGKPELGFDAGGRRAAGTDWAFRQHQQRMGKQSAVTSSPIQTYLRKQAEQLDAAERKALPKGAFALPGKADTPQGKARGGSYPIPDLAHARNALARSSGKPEEAAVRRAVYAKFPELEKRAFNVAPPSPTPQMTGLTRNLISTKPSKTTPPLPQVSPVSKLTVQGGK